MPRKNKRVDPLSPLFLLLGNFAFEILFVFLFASYAIALQPTYLEGVKAYYDFMIIGFTLCVAYVAVWALFFFSAGGTMFIMRERKARYRLQPTGRRLSIPFLLMVVIFILVGATISVLANPNLGDGPRSTLTRGAYGKFMFLMIAAGAVAYWYGLSTIINRTSARDSKIVIFIFLILAAIYGGALWQMGGRARALELILGTIFIFHYLVRPFSIFEVFLVFLSLLSVALFLGGGALLILDSPYLFFAYLFGFEGGRNFDALYNLSAILNEFWDKPVVYGSGMLNGILSDIGLQFSDTTRELFMRAVFGHEEVLFGVSATRVGEAFINFGFIGIIGFAAAAGYLSAKVQRATVGSDILGPAVVIVYYALQFRMGLVNISKYWFENIVNPMAYVFIAIVLLIFSGGYYRVRKVTYKSQTAHV